MVRLKRTGKRTNTIVYTSDEQVRVSGEAKSLVHDGLVVTDDVDTWPDD